jgi:excisionase family DNA binding protein
LTFTGTRRVLNVILDETEPKGAQMEMPNLYTPQQVAEYLKVSRGTIYSLVSRHEIESLKVGRGRRFTAQQVSDYVANRQQVVVSEY